MFMILTLINKDEEIFVNISAIKTISVDEESETIVNLENGECLFVEETLQDIKEMIAGRGKFL